MHRAFARSLPCLIALTVALLGGCAQPAPITPGVPAVLVALHISGGGVPSTLQVTKVHDAIRPVMAQAGLQLASTKEQADYILTATFTPDPVDPNGGRLTMERFDPVGRSRLNTRNPSADQLKQMQERIQNLERWGQRSEIGR